MSLKLITTLLFLYFMSGNSTGSDFYPEKTAERLIKKALKNKNISIIDRLEITETNVKKEPIVVYKIIDISSSDHFRFAVFTQAKGRYDFFDYLVIVSDNGMVEIVDVVKYRSEHGGEIASKKWLRQFENYSEGELKYGTDISAISGATLSAKSVTHDIPIVIQLMKNSILAE